jgi:hypothetical protein
VNIRCSATEPSHARSNFIESGLGRNGSTLAHVLVGFISSNFANLLIRLVVDGVVGDIVIVISLRILGYLLTLFAALFGLMRLVFSASAAGYSGVHRTTTRWPLWLLVLASTSRLGLRVCWLAGSHECTPENELEGVRDTRDAPQSRKLRAFDGIACTAANQHHTLSLSRYHLSSISSNLAPMRSPACLPGKCTTPSSLLCGTKWVST